MFLHSHSYTNKREECAILENWKKELEKIKEVTEKEVLKIRKEEKELRDRHKEDSRRIMSLIHSQLKAVEEIFKIKGEKGSCQPKIEKWADNEIGLLLPIVVTVANTTLQHRIYPEIRFNLVLTDEGYEVVVEWRVYQSEFADYACSIFGRHRVHIPPPVRIQEVQKEINAFLERRSQAIIDFEKYLTKISR